MFLFLLYCTRKSFVSELEIYSYADLYKLMTIISIKYHSFCTDLTCKVILSNIFNLAEFSEESSRDYYILLPYVYLLKLYFKSQVDQCHILLVL